MAEKRHLFEEIELDVRNRLDDTRFRHSLGVAYTASCLAMRYGEDPDDLYLAGLLHDVAKNVPEEERIPLCQLFGIEVGGAEKLQTELLHAKLGAYMAEHQYGVKDQRLLSAIRYHTTGRPGMSAAEAILYVADYIEPGRRGLPNLKEARELAFRDLDRAVLLLSEGTVSYLSAKGVPSDPLTAETAEYYRNRICEKGKDKEEWKEERS